MVLNLWPIGLDCAFKTHRYPFDKEKDISFIKRSYTLKDWLEDSRKYVDKILRKKN